MSVFSLTATSLARRSIIVLDGRKEFNAEGFALSQERQPPLASFSWPGAFAITAYAVAAQAILPGTLTTHDWRGKVDFAGTIVLLLGNIGLFLSWGSTASPQPPPGRPAQAHFGR